MIYADFESNLVPEFNGKKNPPGISKTSWLQLQL